MLNSLLDPDVSVLLPDGTRRPLMTFLLPSATFMLAGIALVASIFLPYWRFTMSAPQYPKGLRVEVYVNQLAGDVGETDALNHYLGMPPLDEGGQLERSISIYAIGAIALLLLGALFVHNRWASLFALPVIAYPFVFLADLYYILYQYGHSIDPQSALGGAIEPFTPPLIGQGMVGQFGTLAEFQPGLYLAFLAALLAVVGLYLHRAAYRPVMEARKKVALKAARA
jgi:hypothetical protein